MKAIQGYEGNQITSWDKCDWQPREAEKPKLAPTKLSEAIRIGARLRPQATGRLFREGASCALGAAYEAMFGAPPEDVWGNWETVGVEANVKAWDRLREVFPHATYGNVGRLNDAGMTREAIADGLESQGL